MIALHFSQGQISLHSLKYSSIAYLSYYAAVTNTSSPYNKTSSYLLTTEAMDSDEILRWVSAGNIDQYFQIATVTVLVYDYSEYGLPS